MPGEPSPARLPRDLLARCAAFDLEVDAGGRITAIGAVRGEEELRIGRGAGPGGLVALDEFVAGAEFVVGHNLLFHDLRVVQGLAPRADLLRMPVLDTLLLSPLAYPRRPYHRLVKDYKLVRTSENDPVADARLALRLLGDLVDALARAPVEIRGLCGWALGPEIAAREIVAREVAERPGGFGAGRVGRDARPDAPRASDHGGQAALFRELGAPGMDDAAARAAFATLHAGQACRSALEPALSAQAARDRIPLAYVATWLSASGTGSVLPAWVRRVFPDVIDLVQRLRGEGCGDSGCPYCVAEHDPEVQLRRYFGYDGFRPEPRAPDGTSLQRAVVAHGMRGASLLAILPTGGGKSLCFQIPAIVRHRRSGQLTVVISPLQALMKDQVDGFEQRTQSNAAAALNGLLTPPERADVLERVRLGEIALLYVSPEQLRSTTCRRVLEQREIGAWVFDEAHCLSKWGHDFRPDYLYAARFIRETAARQQRPVPTIACLTATAKHDVRDEILAHFRDVLGHQLALFEGGVERPNLEFVVEGAPRAQKYTRIRDLVEEVLADRGVVIVYCGTRRETEVVEAFLGQHGIEALAYHAGLDGAQRRERQNAFLRSDVRVVCATNAFGMGIDKSDVRLVVHAQMPGSLESYLQEAGRAGRDQAPARCVLLHAAEDPEDQFRLHANSRLSHHDIQAILRGLRRLRARRRGDDDQVVATAGELLRDDSVGTSFGPEDRDAPTRVVTAIAWLERSGFVQRDENRVGMISARPKIVDPKQVSARIAELVLPPLESAMWRQVHRAILLAEPDRGIDTDDLAGLRAFRVWDERRERAADPRDRATTASQKVLRVLHDMARAGVISDSVRLTAFVRDRVARPSRELLEGVAVLERAMLDALREEAPDADTHDGWHPLSLRRLNQMLLDREVASDPDRLRKLLYGLSRDGRGLAARGGSLELRHSGGDAYLIRFGRRWDDLVTTAERRRDVARVALDAMLACIPAGAPPRKDQLVDFSIEDVRNAIDGDLILRAQVEDPLAAIDRALMFLHELGIVVLQRGLSVFRRAMTLRVPRADGRQYARRDYQPLQEHYAQQTQGVHVMARYAEQGIEDVGGARRLVADYFALTREEFVRRHFTDVAGALERQTGPRSFAEIVEALGNPAQQRVVTAPADASMLVLAGPGSGKTRVVVHRCAFLLRVLRVPARAVLMICFNRATALELRRRLVRLVGADAAGVTVTTYHGVAARLCGRSFAGRAADRPVTGAELDGLITEATELLEGRRALAGLEPDEQRERLLGGFRHILVDEYQDIDAGQYALVSALAGRGLTGDGPRTSLLAVGDDDQAIYGFRDADVAFIQRFREDYEAEVHELLDNYRSTAAIVAATNAVIATARRRMKTEPIRVDARRREGSRGAPVAVVEVKVRGMPWRHAQALAAFDELVRLRADLPQGAPWSECAVLAWHRETLAPLRALCEERGVPVQWSADDGVAVGPWTVREVAAWLDAIHERARGGKGGTIRPSELRALREEVSRDDAGSPWWGYVDGLIEAWDAEIDGDVEVPATRVLDFLSDCMFEDRRQRTLRDGVVFRTLHGAKGLEFPTVLLLDGGFGADDGSRGADEQRRLFYVGATRARERLSVFAVRGSCNPHVAPILTTVALRQHACPVVTEGMNDLLTRRYEVLGMQDVFLDYAGRRRASDATHTALGALRPGDELRLVDAAPRVLLVDGSGRKVAELSAHGSSVWRPRLDVVERVSVLAVLRRSRPQCSPDYADGCVVERWELPLVELTWRRRPGLAKR